MTGPQHLSYPAPLAPIAPRARLPGGSVIDADAVLLALDDLAQQLHRTVDPLRELAPFLARHPVKDRLSDRNGKRFHPSPMWPDSADTGHGSHKVLLDRLRKLAAAELATCERCWGADGHAVYEAGITPLGTARASIIRTITTTKEKP